MLIFNGLKNVDHKDPGPNFLPVSMVDSEGLQAWDVWVSWRLEMRPRIYDALVNPMDEPHAKIEK